MTDSRDNLRGILLMVAAMGGFALEDMFIKWAAAGLPTGQILLMLGLAGTPVFAAMARHDGARAWSRLAWHPAVVWRNLGEMIGTLGFVTALALTPLTSATAIFQAAPLAVTLGAALFLGEKVGWRRWSAILIGLVGVLVILRPGLDGFTVTSLLAVAGLIGFAGRDLATRAAPKVLSNFQLGIYGFAAMVPTGAGLLVWQGGAIMPGPGLAVQLALATVIGVAAYWALTVAMRTGEVSVVTPFRYTRLVFALILGALVFGERPDAMTLLGSAIVVAAGLYTLLRSRAVARGGA